MKYKIYLDDEDFVRFNIFYMNHTKAGKRSKNAMWLRAPIMATFVVIIFIMAGARKSLIIAEAIAMTLISVLLVVTVPMRMEGSLRRRIKKMSAEGKAPYSEVSEIEFQELKIVEKSDRGETHINYTSIEDVCAEEDYLYIFFNTNPAFILPRNCVGEDWDRVIAYLEEKRSRQLFA